MPATKLERFLARVAVSKAGCWVWTGCMSDTGYGHTGLLWPRKMSTHRASWILHSGQEIPAGLCVLHRCDNRACVRPDHLWLGTREDNHYDMVGKGRGNPQYGALTAADIRAIVADRAAGVTCRALAVRHGVHAATISRVARGVRKGRLHPSATITTP